MAGNQWAHRVPGPRGLQEVRTAAHDLAEQAKRAPGGSGPVFQNVAQVLLIGTALISGAVGLVHLWKILEHSSNPGRGGRGEPEPHGPDRDESSQRTSRPEHHKALHGAKETNSAEVGHRWR